MINIITKKFKDQWRGIIYYLVGLIAYAWSMIGLYPSMEKANLEEMVKNYPKEILKFFGGENGINSYSTIEGFLSMEYLSIFFILIIAFYVSSSAGSTIAGAIEKKTLDFQLSQPISRTKLLLSETTLGLIMTAAIVIISTVAMWLLALVYNVDLKNDGLIAFTIVAIFFLWAIYGLAIFLSSFMKSKIAVVATTVFVILGLFIFSSLTQMVDKIKDYDRFSPFFLYKPDQLLKTGTINENNVLILACITLVGIISSLIIFNRRDI